MPDTLLDVTDDCAAIYAAARTSQAAPPGPAELAARLLGDEGIRYHDGMKHGDAALLTIRGAWYICVRPGLRVSAEAFAVARCLAAWHLRGRETTPAAVAKLAAAIQAPAAAFRAAVERYGENVPALAAVFRSTHSLAALRIGEVLERPTVLVTKTRVRVRGRPIGVPEDEQRLRELAAAPLPGIRRARLADDPSRVLLTAAG